MAPASTVLVPSTVSEGDPLFPVFWRHVLHRFPGAYAPNSTMRGPFGPEYLGHPEVVPTQTTIGPLGPDYFDGSPGDRAPERRDRAGDKEGGDRHRNTNITPSLSRVLAARPAPLPRSLRSESDYAWPLRA